MRLKQLFLVLTFTLVGGVMLAAERPNVLIIGDSISIGYTPYVKAALSNRMEVVHAPGNNSATVTGLKKN